jgi:hypothetical protein
MGWYRDLKAVLAGEPEPWLAYLHGQQLDNLSLLKTKRPRYRGLVLQVAKYVTFLLRDLKFNQRPELKCSAKFFVFAGSANQIGSLNQTIDSLKQSGQSVLAVGNKAFLDNSDRAARYVPFSLNIVDVLRSIILLTTRGFGLYKTLRATHPVSVDWHFATFCSVYNYLVYFHRVLRQVKPEFVITANDHNVPNRCFLAVAHQLGIKTVYLQHASVSSIFPALRVDYAFLDGQCALDTYRQCEPNQPATARNVPIPQVILSGQKKHLKRSESRNTHVVGVALNTLDDVKASIELINALAREGLSVRLRWHPGQAVKDTKQFREAFAANERVSLSDPRQEPISSFMERIDWLIAGNSSIHLEAALAGVMPIYHELTPPDMPDYYGYVKNGLTQPADSVEDLLALVKSIRDNHVSNAEAIRYYSATYLTEWESREGELVAECLKRLCTGEGLPVEAVGFELEVPARAAVEVGACSA